MPMNAQASFTDMVIGSTICLRVGRTTMDGADTGQMAAITFVGSHQSPATAINAVLLARSSACRGG